MYGVPPAGNANFAWVQHFIHHLAPNGTAGFVLANGSLSSKTGGEGEIRRKLVEADLVDCIVALPGKLFFNTGIPVCLWFLAKNRANGNGHRDRAGEVLFIDARKLGRMETRTVRVLDEDDIAQIAGHLPRVARPSDAGPTTRTCRVLQGGHARRDRATTTSCSRRAATSARRRPRTTTSRSTKARSASRTALSRSSRKPTGSRAIIRHAWKDSISE